MHPYDNVRTTKNVSRQAPVKLVMNTWFYMLWNPYDAPRRKFNKFLLSVMHRAADRRKDSPTMSKGTYHKGVRLHNTRENILFNNGMLVSTTCHWAPMQSDFALHDASLKQPLKLSRSQKKKINHKRQSLLPLIRIVSFITTRVNYLNKAVCNLPAKRKDNSMTSWYAECPIMLTNIIGETRLWLRPYGRRFNKLSDGRSVDSDREARVSCSRLTHIIWTALIGELFTVTKQRDYSDYYF